MEKKVFCERYIGVLKIVLFILLGLILCLEMKHIMVIHIATDEFGYWTAAANFLGWNWQDIASNNSYYSYGYGIILAPLLVLFEDPVLSYKSALLLNVLLIQCTFLTINRLLQKIYTNVNKCILIGVSFLMCIYPSILFYTKLTIVECLLIYSYAMIVFFLHKYIDTDRIKYVIGIVLICTFMFMVHMRTIIISIALIMTYIIVCLCEKKKEKWMILLGCFIAIVAAFTLEECVKERLIRTQYSMVGQQISFNDFSGQTGKISFFFSLEGIGAFLEAFLGRIYNLGCSSFLFFYLGIYSCIIKIYKLAREQKIRLMSMYVFLILCMLGAVAISSLFMIDYRTLRRSDMLYYGRYSEYIIFPIICIGIIDFIKGEYNKKQYLSFFIVQNILSICIVYWVKKYNLTMPLDVSIPTLYYWIIKYWPDVNVYFLINQFSILIFLLACLCRKIKNKRGIPVLCILISICWIYIGLNSYKISDTHKHDEEYVNLYQAIKENMSEDDKIVYSYNQEEKENNWYEHLSFARIQFCLKDKSIEYVQDSELSKLRGKMIVLSKQELQNEEMDLIEKMGNIYLYYREDNNE